MRDLIRKISHYLSLFLKVARSAMRKIRNALVIYEPANKADLNNDGSSLKDKSSLKMIKAITEPPDLLENLEEVMSDNFFTLRDTDTFSDALCIIFAQNTSAIIVVNEHDEFVGIITAEGLLREVPPSTNIIPYEFRNKSLSFQKDVRESYRSIIKRQIKSLVDQGKKGICLYHYSRVIDALEEVTNLYQSCSMTLVIPILSNDRKVLGIVSYRELLSYISKGVSSDRIQVADFFAQVRSQRYLYKLSPTNTLADACYALSRLPMECVLICDSETEHLCGVLTRLKAFSLLHPLYHYLIKAPLEKVCENTREEQVVNRGTSLDEVIARFLDFDIGFIVVVDAINEHLQPIGVISPVDVLRFLFSKASGGTL